MSEITVIAGNVGADAETRFTQNGDQVTNFNVAVNQGKDRDPKWFRVTCWRKLAEISAEYVKKGMCVQVQGYIRASAYLDQNGHPLASLDLTATNVHFLSSGRKDGAKSDDWSEPPKDMSDVPF